MGLFDVFKKKKPIDWSTKSIKELEGVIQSKSYPSDDDKQFCIMTYINKLVTSSTAIGGFNANASFLSDTKARFYLKLSIERLGIYTTTNSYGQLHIQNYILCFVKNYIANKLPSPISPDYLKEIMTWFKVFSSDDEFDPNDEVLIKQLIADSTSALYSPGLYTKFGSYKFFIAINLCSSKFVEDHCLFRKDAQGNFTDEHLSVIDIIDMDPDSVEQFIDNSIN